MRHSTWINTTLVLGSLIATGAWAADQIEIVKEGGPGMEKPIMVSITGINGEALQVLQFDLYVQGFNFTGPEGAQYLISVSANGNFRGRVTDKIQNRPLISHSYSGESLRRQVHQFVDDFVSALQRKPICRTKIAFKDETRPNSEVFIADFDGHNAQEVTKDGSIVAAPCWVPGRMALYYTSYKFNHADIFHHDLTSGARTPYARFGGSNMSPAPSPDGSKVAMILSKDGWTD